MIIPIGHERAETVRWPIVTLAIIALSLLVYLYEMAAVRGQERTEDEVYLEALEYYAEHPYLEPDPSLRAEEMLSYYAAYEEGMSPEEFEGEFEEYTELLRPESSYEIEQDQQGLDKLTKEWHAIRDASPLRRFGVIPADKSFGTLVTYMFFHLGFLHLFGNMLFLYLAGPPVEDVWGRPLFAVFFLASGVISAALWAVQYPTLDLPLVGASGAVAGVMGAFLVRHWNIRITFFYFWWFVFRIFTGTFRIPAWVVLPLWLISEFLSASLMDSLFPEGGGAVAHLVHVWGFLFGAFVALLMGGLGFEQRFKRALHDKAELMENRALEEAHEARNAGRLDEAWRLLHEGLRAEPRNLDLCIALWDLAMQQGRTTEVTRRIAHCLRHELQSGDRDAARQLLGEMLHSQEELSIDRSQKVVLAEAVARDGISPEVEILVRSAAEGPEPLPAGMLARLARLSEAVDPALGSSVASQALATRGLPDTLRSELERLAQAGSGPGPAPDEHATPSSEVPPQPPAPSVPPTAKPAFNVLSGIPSQLAPKRMAMQVAGKGKVALKMGSVFGIGVARIEEHDYLPYLLLDLLIEPLNPQAQELRLVRLLSSHFDAQRLVPEEATTDGAFVGLALWAVRESGAPLCVGGSELARKLFPTFASIQAYETALRGGLIGPTQSQTSGPTELLSELPPLPTTGEANR